MVFERFRAFSFCQTTFIASALCEKLLHLKQKRHIDRTTDDEKFKKNFIARLALVSSNRVLTSSVYEETRSCSKISFVSS